MHIECVYASGNKVTIEYTDRIILSVENSDKESEFVSRGKSITMSKDEAKTLARLIVRALTRTDPLVIKEIVWLLK